MIRLTTAPSRRQLNEFRVAWFVFFVLSGLLAAWRSSPTTAWMLGAIAVVAPIVGWVWPPSLRWLYVALSVVTFPIGLVISSLVLAVVYYLVLTPTGLCLRWLRPGFFPKVPDRSAPTYWQPRLAPRAPGYYFKQY